MNFCLKNFNSNFDTHQNHNLCAAQCFNLHDSRRPPFNELLLWKSACLDAELVASETTEERDTRLSTLHLSQSCTSRLRGRWTAVSEARRCLLRALSILLVGTLKLLHLLKHIFSASLAIPGQSLILSDSKFNTGKFARSHVAGKMRWKSCPLPLSTLRMQYYSERKFSIWFGHG